MKSRVINSVDTEMPQGGYSQALEISGAERILFVSGQIPTDKLGQCPDNFEDQARQVWANIESQLIAAGMNFDNLVRHTTYLANRKFCEKNSKIRQSILGNHRAALTVIIAEIYDEAWLLEVEAIAVA